MVHADTHTALSCRVDATVDLETAVSAAARASPATESDLQTCLRRVDEAVEHRAELGLSPVAAVLDKRHHCGENLPRIAERGLAPLVRSPRRRTGPEGFGRDDYVDDEASDTCRCPADETLTSADLRGERPCSDCLAYGGPAMGWSTLSRRR